MPTSSIIHSGPAKMKDSQRTDYEHYARLYADIASLVGDAGSVNLYKPKDAVLIVSTFKYAHDEPVLVDSCFNEIRRLAGPGAQTKLTAERDQNNGKLVVRITASFRT